MFRLAWHIGSILRRLDFGGGDGELACLNFMLVPRFGILGAAFATLGAFFIQLVFSTFMASRSGPFWNSFGGLYRIWRQPGYGACVRFSTVPCSFLMSSALSSSSRSARPVLGPGVRIRCHPATLSEVRFVLACRAKRTDNVTVVTETYMVDGQNITAEDCRKIFLLKLGDRQRRVLDLDRRRVQCWISAAMPEISSQKSINRFPDKTVMGIDYFDDHIRIAKFVFPDLASQFPEDEHL